MAEVQVYRKHKKRSSEFLVHFRKRILAVLYLSALLHVATLVFLGSIVTSAGAELVLKDVAGVSRSPNASGELLLAALLLLLALM